MSEQIFMGNALCAVDRDGRIILPDFVSGTLARRSNAATILLGCHETDTCLVAYDPAQAGELQSDCRRRRLAEEISSPGACHARARRIFGLLQAVSVDDEGACILPGMLCRRARIVDAALVVGTGAAFEVWSPQVALYGHDAGMRALATLSLPQISQDKSHAASLHFRTA